MDSLAIASSAVSPFLTLVPTNNQHGVNIKDNGPGASISPVSESISRILHKMGTEHDEIIQAKSVNSFLPGIPRGSPSSLSKELPGQTESVGMMNNGVQPFGASLLTDETQDKGESAPRTKPSSELSPRFDVNNSLGTCPDVVQSRSSNNVGSSLNLSTSCVLPTASGVAYSALPPSQAGKTQQQGLRSDLPQPPKKPLSPYMRFSKGIWQQVKTANPSLSVCEVGATIGRIWRELDDPNKQRFILEFNNDKVRYETELQGYLLTNGLQASDIIKPRAKKTPKDPSKRSKGQNQKNHDVQHDPATGTNCHRPTAAAQSSSSSDVHQMNYTSQEHGNQEMSVALPSFSQVWPNPDPTTQRDLLAQVVYDSQLHDERELSEVESANQSISIFANQAQLAANSVPSGICSSEQKIQQLKVPAASHVKTEAGNWWWSVENGEKYLARNALQQTGNTPVQQPSAGGSSFTEVAVKREDGLPSSTSEALSSNSKVWNEGSGIMVCKGTGVGNAWAGQQPDATLRVQNANSEKVSAIDAEKLFLRGALVEKTQEVVQLMRELDQAYGLIHQLKTQNDFFYRWYQEQRSARE